MNRFFRLTSFIISISLVLVIGCSSDSKSLAVSPSILDFKDVNIGEMSELEITITNKYDSELIIKALDIVTSTDFVITSPYTIPIWLDKNADFKCTIKFEPSTSGKIVGALSIVHDQSEDSGVVSLTGVGIACARIGLSERAYNFTKKPINKSHTHDLEISNVGTDDLNITNLSFTGTGAAAYKVTSAPISIVPGSKKIVTITFEPTALTKYDADLIIEHNGVNENAQFVYSVTGEGRDSDPQITLSQASPWDFGKIVVSSSWVQDCDIENTGIDPLNISSISLQTAAEFTVESLKDSNGNPINLPTDIAVGDKIVLELKFSPSALNTFNDSLVIEHNGTNEVTPWNFPVTGEGVAPKGFDFNGDGITDIIIGADMDDDGGTDSGCAYIFFGKTSPSSSIDASQADVKFVGQDIKDQFGHFVSSIGDFNNDGYDDVIVGASLDDDGGIDSGCAFIFFGSATPAGTIDASAANVKLVGGDPDDRFGIRVSNAGDFNKDGYDDVIVGALQDDDGGIDAGCAFIFFGSASPSKTIDASAADVKLVGGDPKDRFGVNVSDAGDFNSDGYDDVIVGADCDDDGGTDSGCAFIFFGSASPLKTIDASAASVKLVGADPADKFGYNVCEKSLDFNNDGYDDVVVGAHADDDGGKDSGCAFVFFGSATSLATIDASAANVKFVGGDPADGFGIRVSSAGDFDGDGFDDVLVGAYNDDDGGNESGCAFIFFGTATPLATIDSTAANVKLIGADTNNKFGHFVCLAGDFNNDGYADVITGAYLDDDGGTDSGCAFLFFGSASPASTIDASAANVKFVGADPYDRFGVTVGG